MIVTCTACQTRFRIPDERVGPRGARVRCSRCRATFVVRRDDSPTAASPPSATPPPLPAAAPVPAPSAEAGRGRPPADLDLDLSGNPFAPAQASRPEVRPDDPFAPRPTPLLGSLAPAAAPDPPPARAGQPPPFAGAPPLPFAPVPPGDPFAGTPPPFPSSAPAVTGGLALEEAEQRPPGHAPGFDALAALAAAEAKADFRTPGPSGLEVDERVTSEQVLPPEPSPPPAPAAPEAPPRASPPSARPLAPPGDATAITTASPRRRLLPLLVNGLSLALLLGVAAALFAYWRGGLWRPGALRPPQQPFAARDLSSGRYETRGGREVLFVKGTVVSGKEAGGPVQVRVELVDRGRPVARAVGLAGAVPTPEQVWSLRGAPEADQLRAALAARAPARVAAGQALPFLVVFWDYPADLRGLDLRVVAGPPSG